MPGCFFLFIFFVVVVIVPLATNGQNMHTHTYIKQLKNPRKFFPISKHLFNFNNDQKCKKKPKKKFLSSHVNMNSYIHSYPA